MSDFSAKLIEIADFDYGDPASGDRLLHANWLRGAAEHIKGLESQATEIESLRARLESQTSVKMYTLLLDERDALTEKVERYSNALSMIAGDAQCIDNLLSNSEIAKLALATSHQRRSST